MNKSTTSMPCIWHSCSHVADELKLKVMNRATTSLAYIGRQRTTCISCRLLSPLTHHLNKCVLLAKLLIKVIHLSFKFLYLRTKLCYKSTLLHWHGCGHVRLQ